MLMLSEAPNPQTPNPKLGDADVVRGSCSVQSPPICNFPQGLGSPFPCRRLGFRIKGICIYICVYKCIYIYIDRERGRERER